VSAAPGQTVGPFFHLGLPYPGGNDLVPPGRAGAIRLHGRVFDGGNGNVVRTPGGSLHRDGWTFSGFGRAQTDGDGHYRFTTVEPGPTEPGRPAFFAVTVFARGLLDRLFTRAYLPGPGPDPLLDGLSPERRATLLTTRDEQGLVFDIRLQGEDETVFLSFPRHRGLWT
jgi:protocatechuate 3,4-dioxygenase alpha subunit